MASVNVTINGRSYQIACDDGQEAHLKRLGNYIDKRIAELVASVGQIGDARLLVMASLLIADEMSDAYSRLEAAEGQKADGPARKAREQEALASSLNAIADRIDRIADSLERP
jgi:cell division protein ZapA